MSDNFVSEITLECLMNKEQYAKYINIKSASSETAMISNRKDKKFYKKRIYDLTKQLLNNEKPERMYPDITSSFELYIKVCIEYFKALDKTDILQEDYNGLIPNVIDTNNAINIENAKNTEEANKLMMRLIKITEPNSLEKLVKRTHSKEIKPQIPPKQKDINLKDPILKNKGIRKKKNITNKYDEIKIQENQDDKKK